jgi:hypothetical protein
MRAASVLPVVCLLALPASATDPAVSDASLRITTDNAEYCEALSTRLPPQGELTLAARNLAQEGLRLCASGHVRTGIAKLRRALRVSQQETRASAD